MKTVIVITSDTSSGLESKVNEYLKEYKEYSPRVINYTSHFKNKVLEYSGMIERETEIISNQLVSKVSDKNSNSKNNIKDNNKK